MIVKALKWSGLAAGVLVLVVVGFVGSDVMAFNRSMNKVWDVPPLDIRASDDPHVIARGRHLAESIGGCTACHGEDLGGRPSEDFGPLGVLPNPNLTRGEGGVGYRYSDGELARAIRHGIRSDGTGLVFMPVHEIDWWGDEDVKALVSYLRSVPPVDRDPGTPRVGVLAKVLDRRGLMTLDVARRIDHAAPRPEVRPAATVEYGARMALLCTGCHGEGLSGGSLPGMPPDAPVPSNLTPHETGLAAWDRADLDRLLDQGLKADGSPLDPFMPVTALRNMDETERQALFLYLRSVEPRELGGR